MFYFCRNVILLLHTHTHKKALSKALPYVHIIKIIIIIELLKETWKFRQIMLKRDCCDLTIFTLQTLYCN